MSEPGIGPSVPAQRTPADSVPDRAVADDAITFRNYRTPTPTAVAWAPLEPPPGEAGRGRSVRATSGWYLRREPEAVAWLEREREAAGVAARALRVTYASDASHIANAGDEHGHRLLRSWADGDIRVVTNQDGSVPGGHATYVPRADATTLAGAMWCADRAPLVVTEGPLLPLAGWAAAMQAVNLATGEITPDERTEEQRDHVDFICDQTYQGWTTGISRVVLISVCAQLAETGMSWVAFLGSVLAQAPERFDLDAMRRVAPRRWQAEIVEVHDRALHPFV